MNIKALIQLGDILILKDGRVYIYLICPDVGYSSNKSILLRKTGNYFGAGLEGFDDNLVHKNTGDKIISIYRPSNPLTEVSCKKDFFDHYNIEDFLKDSVQIYPDNVFINIEEYV